MEYICLYLCLIFPEISNTQQHNNEEATCELLFFFKGFALHLCADICHTVKTIKIYLKVVEQTFPMYHSYVISHRGN